MSEGGNKVAGLDKRIRLRLQRFPMSFSSVEDPLVLRNHIFLDISDNICGPRFCSGWQCLVLWSVTLVGHLAQRSPTPGPRTSTGLWVIWYQASPHRKKWITYSITALSKSQWCSILKNDSFSQLHPALTNSWHMSG